MLALGSKTQAENTGEKDRFVKIIARHVLLDSTRYLLEELIDGLRTLGVYDKIKENTQEFAKCLCRFDKPLTAATVDALFQIEYAEPRSNRYAAQQRAIVYWRDYLQDCEGKSPYNIVNRLQRCNTPKSNYYYKLCILSPYLAQVKRYVCCYTSEH